MIVDGRTLTEKELNFDICIVGSGPAGMTVALELQNTKKRICVLEAGDLRPTKESQDFYKTELLGPHKPSSAFDTHRYRCFGGTSCAWAGGCAPLDKSDFEPLDFMPYSGWPITLTDLAPFYKRAHSLLDLGHFDFKSENWADTNINDLSSRLWTERGTYNFNTEKKNDLKFKLIKFQDREIISKLWHFNSVRFGQKFGPTLHRSSSITVILNTALTEIVSNDKKSHIKSVVAKVNKNKFFKINAKMFVLACGGIENTRILLTNQKLKNLETNKNIGSTLMTHFFFYSSVSSILHESKNNLQLYLKAYKNNTRVKAFFQFNEQMRKTWKLGNLVLGFAGFPSFNNCGKQIYSMSNKLFNSQDKLSNLRFLIMAEQIPNPKSQVSLSEMKDKLDIPRAKINWHPTEYDYAYIIKALNLFASKLGQNNLGRLRIKYDRMKRRIQFSQSVGHPMGTTKMANSSKTGVVDKNCKLFNVDNFYVTGSSVFPTGGVSNPTFTIVALSIRLADHIKKMI